VTGQAIPDEQDGSATVPFEGAKEDEQGRDADAAAMQTQEPAQAPVGSQRKAPIALRVAQRNGSTMTGV